VQRRRERENRQINERLKTLIAAYKTLGGSFTGDLAVDPRHLRDLRTRSAAHGTDAVATLAVAQGSAAAPEGTAYAGGPGAERRRRVRDAVEAALADVIVLGTEEQVRLAVRAADEMVAGRSIELAELVVSLRTFIRDALDLDPVPAELTIPRQGPLRAAESARAGGGGGERAGGGGAAGGRGAAGMGAGIGAGVGIAGVGARGTGALGPAATADDADDR
jgi:hypothetical protein